MTFPKWFLIVGLIIIISFVGEHCLHYKFDQTVPISETGYVLEKDGESINNARVLILKGGDMITIPENVSRETSDVAK